MLDTDQPNWKRAIRERLDEIEPSMLEELSQHLEARFEELQSYDAVMSEWSAVSNLDELRAELARIKRRQSTFITLGTPAANVWHSVWQDLRYGLRQLRLSPGFAAVAVLSLALGIGANTAVFQLVDAVRLRMLPVEHPQELLNIKIATNGGRSGSFMGHWPQATNAMWEQIREKQEGFSGVVAWNADSFELASGGESRVAHDGLWVSGSFFDVLGVRPELGRVFSAADDQRGCAGAAVISHAFWQREYGGDPTVVGRKINLSGHPFDIIGVTRPDFLAWRSATIMTWPCRCARIRSFHRNTSTWTCVAAGGWPFWEG